MTWARLVEASPRLGVLLVLPSGRRRHEHLLRLRLWNLRAYDFASHDCVLVESTLLFVVAWAEVVLGLFDLLLLLFRWLTSKAHIILNPSLGLQRGQYGVAQLTVLANVVSYGA